MPVIPGDNDQCKFSMKDKLADGAKEAEQAKSERQAGGSSQQTTQTNPVIAEKMPEPASKEELKERMAELNKK